MVISSVSISKDPFSPSHKPLISEIVVIFLKSSEQEIKTLDKWIDSKANNPIYRFGNQRFDPSSQTEGIGNNQVQASTYGIKNLKIVAKNLQNWTSNQTNNYEDLTEIYGELLSVWSRYVGHVAGNI